MKRIPALLVLGTLFFSGQSLAAVIPFSGPLRIIFEDEGGRYSGTPLETIFTGEIDDQTFSGFITDGSTRTDFGCCIFAGGLDISNDVELDAGLALALNTIAGANVFSPGEIVDIVDLEGDTATPGDGRIEVGLSFILNGSAFPDGDPGNYPFDPGDLRLAAYFISEDDFEGASLYDAVGLANIIPVPAALWLFASALGLLGWLRARPS